MPQDSGEGMGKFLVVFRFLLLELVAGALGQHGQHGQHSGRPSSPLPVPPPPPLNCLSVIEAEKYSGKERGEQRHLWPETLLPSGTLPPCCLQVLRPGD